MARFEKFEVQVFRDQRWVLETTLEDEAKAKAHYQNLLKKSDNEGARVVRTKRLADGSYNEEVIAETLRKGEKKKDYSIADITSAPPCQSYLDLYKTESRSTIGRLLVRYIDETVITPTELLHDSREFKRAMDAVPVAEAVDRVATLQANQAGAPESARTRRDELFAFLDQALTRARPAGEQTDLPRVKSVGFAAALKLIDQAAPDKDRDFLALVALTRELVERRTWPAKIAMLLGEIDKAGKDASKDGRALPLLDGVLADIFDARNVVSDLIGSVPDLATYLIRLKDLCAGRAATDWPDESPLRVVAQLFAANQLQRTRASVLEQFQRLLRSSQPLVKTEPKAEFEAFRNLLERVITPPALFGGPLVAEAMALRYAAFLKTGGVAGRREAISTVASILTTAMQQVRYYVALAGSDLGREQSSFISTTLESFITNARRIEDLVGLQGTPKTRMQEIVKIHDFLCATVTLPAKTCQSLAARLDDMIAQYLIDNQVIEKMDNPGDSLRIRAMRLVQFCTSGVLTNGKATTMARDRVLTILRQPKFEQKFTADIPDPSAQEKALREFHQILAKTGFLAAK
ncbi:MAG: hypothetical protein HQL37_16460 [Alphaproteobacteria bacterium]|nr:hypothetical protein [Alphaproteobacteria bacterium]